MGRPGGLLHPREGAEMSQIVDSGLGKAHISSSTRLFLPSPHSDSKLIYLAIIKLRRSCSFSYMPSLNSVTFSQCLDDLHHMRADSVGQVCVLSDKCG